MENETTKPTEIAVIDETTIRNKIYEVRGQKVMLDFDLAEIYGYETKSFNRQVRNNIDRFAGEDFMFRLTKEELEILRCKNFTSSWGGTRYLPYAFAEAGILTRSKILTLKEGRGHNLKYLPWRILNGCGKTYHYHQQIG